MKVGDLVRNLSSESKMPGVVIKWSDHKSSDPQHERLRGPVVMWSDGRINWIVRHLVEVISESR